MSGKIWDLGEGVRGTFAPVATAFWTRILAWERLWVISEVEHIWPTACVV